MRVFILLFVLLIAGGCSARVQPAVNPTNDAVSDRSSIDASDDALGVDVLPDQTGDEWLDGEVRLDVASEIAAQPCESRPSRVVQLFPGPGVQFALTAAGCVWVWGAWGSDTTWNFGRARTSTSHVPELIPIPGHFRSVHREFNTFCAIRTDDDTAWCWSGDRIEQVRSPLPVREIITLYNDSARCIRLADQSVWCAGRLDYLRQEHASPLRITDIEPTQHLRTCWARPASFIPGMGIRLPGVPEPGYLTFHASPPDALADTCQHGEHTVCFLTRNRTVHCRGDNMYNLIGGARRLDTQVPLTQIQGLERISQICGGADRMVALREDGTIWHWGKVRHENESGTPFLSSVPLRVGTVDDAVHVAYWRDNLLFVRRDGSVWQHSLRDEQGRPVLEPQLLRIARFGEP